MVSISGTLDVDLVEQTSPSLRLFFSSDIKGDTVTIPLEDGRTKYPFSLTGTTTALREDSILGIDCMCEETSEAKKAARMRSGYDSVYFDVLKQVFKDSDLLQCNLENANAEDLHVGKVTLHITSLQVPSTEVIPGGFTYGNQRKVSTLMSDFIVKSFGPFKRKEILPAIPQVENIHAPMFMARGCVLPGYTYWKTPWVGFDETYLEHLAAIVCARHDTSPSTLRTDDRRSHEILADMCTAYPNSCRYISDFYQKGSEMFPFESFDDLFIRQAGDCEDLSKAMCYVFDCIRKHEWKGTTGRTLQRIAQGYCAFSILGAVARPAFTLSPLGNDMAAHMWAKLFPVEYVEAWTGKKDLGVHLGGKPLIMEGTGYVGTDVWRDAPSYPSRYLSRGIQTKNYMRVKNDFYHYAIHGFSSTLSDIGHVTFMRGNHYGVPFEDVMNGSTDVSLYIHPLLPDALTTYTDAVMRHETPSPRLTIEADVAQKNNDVLLPPGQDIFVGGADATTAELTKVQNLGGTFVKEDFGQGHWIRRFRVHQ